MAQYIDKSALVAEIERLKNTSLEYGYNTMQRILADSGKDISLRQLQNFIDTLEVKEVDLNKEIENYFNGFGKFPSVGIDDCIDIAKHFFELGLKAQKGE